MEEMKGFKIKLLKMLVIVSGFVMQPQAHSSTPQEPNKFVGAMYSIWFDSVNRSGYRPIYPQDVSAPSFRYWGEPANGRYMSSDVYTINRHADELVELGVDFIFIDLSNSGFSEPLQYGATISLLETYQDRLLNGEPFPRITFLVSLKQGNEIRDAYDLVYRNYSSELFFNIGGKPLILVNNSCDAPYSSYFTCKPTWGLSSATDWSFMDATPQSVYLNHDWSEQMPVSAAQQTSFMNAQDAHGRKYDYMAGQNNGYEGQNFDDQWNEAFKNSPTFILVKSYNEWTAQKLTSAHQSACNMQSCYTDQYNREFSSDIEPMKTCRDSTCESHGSLYYDLMKYQIEKFKSTTANMILRDDSSGSWVFRYGRGAKETDVTNYAKIFNWAKGSHYQMITGDFNDDGLNDIGMRDSNTGRWHFAFNNGNHVYHNTRDFNWVSGSQYQPVVGDFNGDNRTDIALRNSSNGRWYFAFFNGTNYYNNTRNFSWASGDHYQPLVGDFNNDNRTDIALRNTSNGRWYFAFFDGKKSYHNTRNFNWASGDQYQPFTGDFNCDNKLDIGLRNTITGNIYLTRFDGSLAYINEHNYKWKPGQNIHISIDQTQCQ
jgi:hypothetical protein